MKDQGRLSHVEKKIRGLSTRTNKGVDTFFPKK